VIRVPSTEGTALRKQQPSIVQQRPPDEEEGKRKKTTGRKVVMSYELRSYELRIVADG